MSLLRDIAAGLRALLQREQVDVELDEELRGYMEMAAQEKMKQGLSRSEAVRAVRLEAGGLESTKEEVRAAGWESFVEAQVPGLCRSGGANAGARNWGEYRDF
jgi:hypothetical protein